MGKKEYGYGDIVNPITFLLPPHFHSLVAPQNFTSTPYLCT